jgi:hypothetical protein
MRELSWLVPSVILTIFSAIFALMMIPDYAGIWPALLVAPFWPATAAVVGGAYGFFVMATQGVRHPFAHAIRYVGREWRVTATLGACILLAGLNMITFMWVKPLLNYTVPFWADPLLADVDHMLFFGRDPWTLFTWLNSSPAATFYHQGWFVLMILTLLIVAKAPPSPEKSAVMLSYFVLWSLIGPLIHVLLPAAGPVFFAQMGHGDRFARLHGVPETAQAAGYLWAIYSSKGFGPGSGISAMPSMHIATTVWMIIAFHKFAHRWVPAMAAAGLIIIMLSISLGWHYAVDCLVGAAAALLCYQALVSFYRNRRSMLPSAQLVSLQAG